MGKYLVVYEDELNNKEAITTIHIVSTIKQFSEDYNLVCEYDEKRLSSENPCISATFGPGFQDIYCQYENGEDAGRIMIFEIYETEVD